MNIMGILPLFPVKQDAYLFTYQRQPNSKMFKYITQISNFLSSFLIRIILLVAITKQQKYHWGFKLYA